MRKHSRQLTILFLSFLFIFFAHPAFSGEFPDDSPKSYKAYFPYLSEDSSLSGSQSVLQILNTTSEESSAEIKFYPAVDSHFKKSIKFFLKANSRIDIPLESISPLFSSKTKQGDGENRPPKVDNFLERGSMVVSSNQEFAAQLILLPVKLFSPKVEKFKEQLLANILAPSRLSELNQEGKAFVFNIPVSYLDRPETKIFVFNPYPQEIQVMLEKVLGGDVQTLKVLRLSSLGSGFLDVPASILEKKEDINFKLVSNQSLAAVVKIGHFPSEQFLPLNPDWQELSASLNTYLFPFGQEGSLRNFYLFLENNDGISQNLVNLEMTIRQDGDIFYKKKNFSLPPRASLKLFPKDMDLGLADLNSLEYICLTSNPPLQGGLVCSADNLEFKFPFLFPIVPIDNTAPSSPILNPVTSPTNINYQMISGVKDADSCLWLNNEPFIPFDDRKDWQYELFFEKGENTFELVAKDRAGNASDPVSAAIVFDPTIEPVGEGQLDGRKVEVKQPPVDIKRPDVRPWSDVAPTLNPAAEVIDINKIRIEYSEEVSGADVAANYSVNPDLGTLTAISVVTSKIYELTFQNAFETNVTYTITVNNVKDQKNHLIDPAQNWTKFTGGVYGKAVLIADLTGENALDYFGHSISFGGDINGDGFQDAVIGAYAHSEKDVNAGRVYVFFGIPDLGDPGVTIPAPNMIIDGQNDYDYFGYSVASAGDINNDGYTDLLVGALYNDEMAENAGKAYLYLGGGFDQINPVNQTPFLEFLGEAKNDQFGTFVTSIGDINADGYDDILVGAPRADNTGKVYVYLGGENMDNQPDLALRGEMPQDYFGSSAVKAGDVNGDGFADFAVGAYSNDQAAIDAGKVYVYFGDDLLENITVQKTFLGEGKGDYFGFSLASSNLNGDTQSDLIVSAYGNDEAGLDAGKVYVYYGGTSLDAQTGLQILGENAGDYFGYALSSANDLNADGKEDLLAGAFGYDGRGGNDSGRIYSFFGGSNLDGAPDLTIDGLAGGDNLGFIVSPAGFFNKDNSSEVIMGAKGTDASGQDTGKVYLYTTDFGKKKKPYIFETNLIDQEIRFINDQTLNVSLKFNEKMDTTVPVKISLGKKYPYQDQTFECRTWDDEFTCWGEYALAKSNDGFNVLKISNAQSEDDVPMAENYYYNVVTDEQKPSLDPAAQFIDANNVEVTFSEDVIYADDYRNYTMTSSTTSVNLIDVERVSEDLTRYRVTTSTRLTPGKTYTITVGIQVQDLAHNGIDHAHNQASFTAVDNASPVVNSFDIYDLDSGAQDFTNSLTVGVNMTDSDQDSSVVKWLLTTSPISPKSEDFTLTARPTSYTFSDPQAGEKYLYAWVLDQSNNVSVYSAASQDSIELDAQGPDIVLDPIDPNPTNNLQITVTGKVEIPDWSSDNYRTVQIKITGDVVGTIIVAPNADLSFSQEITLSSGDNTKSIIATAYDSRGNPGASATQTVLLDTTPPQAPTIDAPITPTNIVQQVLSGTKTQEAVDIILKVNGISVNNVVLTSTAWSILLNLEEGKNKVEVLAEDLAGNESTSAAATIILDTQPPEIEMIYPLEGSVVNGK